MLKKIKRVAFGILLLISVLFMPYWLTIILAFIGILLFPYYFEAVVFLLVSDMLYGVSEARFFHILFLSSGISLIVLFIFEMIKKKLRTYPR